MVLTNWGFGFWMGGEAWVLVKKIRQVARKFEMWLVFLGSGL
jgi:hypothetical protein